VEGAPLGYEMYSWAISAPATEPELRMLAVTVATTSKRSLAPPGTMGPVAGPDLALEVTLISE